MENIKIGIMGGSGLYQMPGLTDVTEHVIDTPYGKPSDALVAGTLNGARVVFLARHGRAHSLIPSEIPFRANIYAMKSLGVRYLLSISAVGSLREDIAPLDMVLPNQFIDNTRQRVSTFFGQGAVAHVSMADPVCSELVKILRRAFEKARFDEIKLHTEKTYVCIEGPSFSSRAESNSYRAVQADVIGMTNVTEAKLAREAQMAYATLALVTDWDCWKEKSAAVTAQAAIANLQLNAQRAQQLLVHAIELLSQTYPPSSAHEALKAGLVTPLDAMSAQARARIEVLLKEITS